MEAAIDLAVLQHLGQERLAVLGESQHGASVELTERLGCGKAANVVRSRPPVGMVQLEHSLEGAGAMSACDVAIRIVFSAPLRCARRLS